MKIVSTLATAAVFATCAATTVFAFQSENTLRIGGMWAITGGVALTGKGALNLSRLAVDEINTAGGVKIGGKQVKLALFAYDEACKEQEGMALLSRLDDIDKVLFTLGPTCSGTAEPMFNTLQKNSTIRAIRAGNFFSSRTQPASSDSQRFLRGYFVTPSMSRRCTSSS
jgi:branched-chain amino acid transport system substrate-binding protein